jgi:hypothetical protein
MRVNHLAARQSGQTAQVGQQLDGLGDPAAGVDHQHLVLTEDCTDVQVEAGIAEPKHPVADLLPAAAFRHCVTVPSR